MQIIDANGARFDRLESRTFEQSDDLRNFDVAVCTGRASPAPEKRITAASPTGPVRDRMRSTPRRSSSR